MKRERIRTKLFKEVATNNNLNYLSGNDKEWTKNLQRTYGLKRHQFINWLNPYQVKNKLYGVIANINVTILDYGGISVHNVQQFSVFVWENKNLSDLPDFILGYKSLNPLLKDFRNLSSVEQVNISSKENPLTLTIWSKDKSIYDLVPVKNKIPNIARIIKPNPVSSTFLEKQGCNWFFIESMNRVRNQVTFDPSKHTSEEVQQFIIRGIKIASTL